jgi:hypothetical protein
MSNSALIVELRKKAIQLLQESSQMFEEAFRLNKAGNSKEAETMRESARATRLDASWIMAEAHKLEQESVAPDDPPTQSWSTTPEGRC